MYKFRSFKILMADGWVDVIANIPEVKNEIFHSHEEIKDWIENTLKQSHYMYTVNDITIKKEKD